ncbi:tRNA preQ1(34) S-adenosylmethionine ribosyltransferase-isomerase QueA [Candidatus Falkowbacteria bacterium RIFOXYB2_FULL_34_18]|uniref:S-adenosylmethionine:tRNA ribosyltransferase-isomerase n=1 Tax=Candidatus Falkowbacteria bacterium RIFOXYD2_FULL_34_120 TaxID=1798007 RepID=A0A1F5TPB4_9BACT|nr:MAG: tRNA preQ1(34) S-adenosylmethionine ribosyltransferase-isomerase QueA [Candidatus Falkowbacteria bacterium RIFOXYB2_FULL_34_18]OGF29081.1 MAG: tRNA preQ1(34) S-adenosylmethionine ribosyltransferase-isomerase QueA [Candidatus Falkowbacteria bacterium RIFOXYC12_FULL_34_55]OGF36140.1 MAG: tRNA preQ1(34) S-adenosylmethionine ribosyltransferase-isomerase QueA [Candidatus Falkowbacteria bacterium RIFOXYC2_FULL_34_220]OGF38592.1 MAG: tRNA preQ1(34) S-adenosylmethionine ribosyltransferase-isomer
MDIKDFDFHLPQNLIAQKPAKPRDHSRLLVLHKNSNKLEHKHFYEIIDYLQRGDILILNNSKVIPARLIGTKEKTAGKVEIFLHHHLKNNLWQCLIGGKRVYEGLKINFSKKLNCKIIKNNNDGTWDVEFNCYGNVFIKVLKKIGQTPLPPYIKRSGQTKEDKIDYQTIYADKQKSGSVAAPTAGLHFTKKILSKLKKKGIQIEYITLHVGLGTFAPVKTTNIKDHKMHAEWTEVNKKVIKNILEAKKNGKRVIAVGTTSTRTLEAIWTKIENRKSKIKNHQDWVDIFIYPGYKFKIVDGMITNFHLPKSTLIMLVSALTSTSKIKKAYNEAIRNKYRFYSYGDAMLII